MFLILLSLIALIGFGWLYSKWRRVKTYWSRRGVPSEAPHPVVGSLAFLQRENVGVWMRKLYTRFDSPYVGIWLFWRPALMINSPEMARRVLVKDADVFRNRFLSSGKSDPLGGMNIFTVNDPLWTAVRRRLTPIFTGSKLRAMQELIIRKSNEFIERVHREIETGEPIHIRQICTDFTTDIVGESAFGLSSEATKTGDSALRRITREFGAFSVYRGLCWSSIFFIPELVDIFRFTFFPRESAEFLKKLFRAIVEQRGGYGREVREPRDLFDALLKMKYEAAKDNEEMSEELLLAQAAIFLQGGFDTSGTALTFTIYEMAHKPQLQERLYEELVETKRGLGGKEFDSSALADMPYLNAVIKETLRKYPPMGWLDRISSKEYRVDDKLTLPAGSVVYVNVVGMQSDPNHFPQPEQYDPDRFLPENERNIPPYTYMPFGDGPRNCIGMRFAQQVMRFAVAKIFLAFRLEPLPKAPKPNEVQIEKNGLFMMPGQKLSVRFIPRPSLSLN
ncbi:hypothetical protein K1T71_000550 [Dendrolimus kikuchii]|uniref:Uncharacterized protein n=1 Tax=Dendrolimus kikuchii TaxID=765133 RepID=A0ACC1DJN6_9NEOP|nr:hypothetical protein K1T71_000550 [Dendrolimus kikuchii]